MMNPHSRDRHGFLLCELLLVIMLSMLITGISWKLIVDAMYLQRVAGQSADRTAVMDSLARVLQRDAASARDTSWEGGSLTLSLADHAGQVVYDIGPSSIRRRQGDVETSVWSAARLSFEPRIEHGSRSDLLLIDFVEQPPPRATVLGVRRQVLSILLPLRAGGDR